ncbi:MAG TPA: hypothetical protein VMN58_01800 [Acidimicrobiales bacterium]|nr:hypothetical protein [Acidimicrobiales bacterium]
MPMRTECKHYESRTYANGDTVRKCDLNLAPEAPWRCPDECPEFSRRLSDVAWSYGTMVSPPTPDEPEGEDIAALLREAKSVVNAAAPDVLEQLDAERRRATGWRRFIPRRRS